MAERYYVDISTFQIKVTGTPCQNITLSIIYLTICDVASTSSFLARALSFAVSFRHTSYHYKHNQEFRNSNYWLKVKYH